MTSERIYLDHNATAPVRPEAESAVLAALRVSGNPSSVHANGRAARAMIEQARLDVAALIGCGTGAVVFTSGGAEANALAIESAVKAGARRLIIGATEHETVPAIAEASGAAVELWPVDGRGVAELDWLSARLADWSADDGAPFVALMLANNETGVIQPVAEAARIVHEAGGWLHVDAVQAAGKITIDFKALDADTMSVSAHKIGGPQGCGALAYDPRAKLSRRLHGGGQERGLRAGTENLPGIAGFGAAARVAKTNIADHAAWRDAAAARLKREASVVVMGEGAPRLSGTLCLAAPGFASDMQVMQMDLAGIMVSAGSACTSGKVKASRTVLAMGHPDLGPYVLRVSSGWNSTAADWERFVDAWLGAHARHAARHPQFAGA
ncbi:MAG TPA: cysteine desulfurase family protein [Caulobacteraceae bacterium]|nr:cysteine desulfurase family protein [Caulobacteraceae bacterium]